MRQSGNCLGAQDEDETACHFDGGDDASGGFRGLGAVFDPGAGDLDGQSRNHGPGAVGSAGAGAGDSALRDNHELHARGA